MKKLFTGLMLVFISLAINFSINAQSTKVWEKNAGDYSFIANDANMRSLTLNTATNHLLVASRTGGSNIIVLNPATGDSLGKLDMTGVSGGTFGINYVRATSGGAIY